MRLKAHTPSSWLSIVLSNMDSFLLDHAACEKKASALAMSLVAHYPDKTYLVEQMISLALEELEHFQQTHSLLTKRNLVLGPDRKDPYVMELRKLLRHQPQENYLLDRLLMCGIIEARGCERFEMVANALEAGDLKDFYMDITRSEARHHGLFVRIAKKYFPAEIVERRLEEMLEQEAEIMLNLVIEPFVH